MKVYFKLQIAGQIYVDGYMYKYNNYKIFFFKNKLKTSKIAYFNEEIRIFNGNKNPKYIERMK